MLHRQQPLLDRSGKETLARIVWTPNRRFDARRPHTSSSAGAPAVPDGQRLGDHADLQGRNRAAVLRGVVLLETPDGRSRLRRYFERHAEIAREFDCGFIAEAPTWRANPDWASVLGYDSDALDGINRRAIALLAELRGRGDGAGMNM
jgi:hypothetical protein